MTNPPPKPQAPTEALEDVHRLSREVLVCVDWHAGDPEDPLEGGALSDYRIGLDTRTADAVAAYEARTGRTVQLRETDAGRGASVAGVAIALLEPIALLGGAAAAIRETTHVVAWGYREVARAMGRRPLVSLGTAECLAIDDLLTRVDAASVRSSGDVNSISPDRSFTGGDAFFVVLATATELHHYQVSCYGEVTHVGASPFPPNHWDAPPAYSADDPTAGQTFRPRMTQRTHQRLRTIFSLRTAVAAVAAVFGFYTGQNAPGQLADALSVGVAITAVVAGFAFALSAAVRRSRSLDEMLYQDRRVAQLGIEALGRAVAVTLLALAFVALRGTSIVDGRLLAALGALSAMLMAWQIASLPLVFSHYIRTTAGSDDEHPDLGGLWKRRRRVRHEVIQDLRRSPAGWYVQPPAYTGLSPSPCFVAQELAIRYGTLLYTAQLHYSQLCDLPEQPEVSDRVERLTGCLSGMEQLHKIDQQLGDLLTEDAKSRFAAE